MSYGRWDAWLGVRSRHSPHFVTADVMLKPAQWQRLVARTSGWTPDKYVPLRVALGPKEARLYDPPSHDLLVGWVLKEKRERLARFPQLFCVSERDVVIRAELESVAARTAAFRAMSDELRAEKAFPLWQDELYAARRVFGDEPLFFFNRGVGSSFGLAQYATHLNGYTRDSCSGGVAKLWIAKRSATKNSWPGRLDTMVGGGLPAHTAVLENMVKESQEEAGLEPQWTRQRLVFSGSISYLLDEPSGLQNNTMFIYDLEMPADMTPSNMDKEVDAFELWSVDQVLEALREEPERFKHDICLVLLDFFIRHGVLTPDNFRDLQRLEHALRSAPYTFDKRLVALT